VTAVKPTNHFAAVWIDHKEAKIFHVEPTTFAQETVRAPFHHVSRKAAEQGRHALSDDFYQGVVKALKESEVILVVGPSSAKLDLLRYMHKHDHLMEEKVVGVETLDHPTDGQLAAYIRHYFLDEAHLHGLKGKMVSDLTASSR
jgi:stalled ribosome rescue protein Dom34